MRMLRMGDSSTPPGKRTCLPAYAFYLSGDTPHVWQPAEVRALDARWGLPIAVHTSPAGDAAADAAVFAERLRELGWEHHVTVAIDTEDAVLPDYLTHFDVHIRAAGWTLMHYESIKAEPGNPLTSGGKWIPDWDGDAALPPGALAAQYENAAMTGQPWDLSVIDAQVPLGEIHPVAVPDIGMQGLFGQVPVLRVGSRGWAVGMLQAMLTRAFPQAAGKDMEDGIYGPVTQKWVTEFKILYGIPGDTAMADALMFETLINRS